MHVCLHLGARMRESKNTGYYRRRNLIMRLHLQFGYGMMEHSKQLLREWRGGTVILSPRDLSPDQLSRMATDVRSIEGADVVLDPQFYLPHSDHERLVQHGYWPEEYETGSFFGGEGQATLIKSLKALNDRLGTSGFYLPGLLARAIDDDWLETQRLTLEEGRESERDKPIWQTIALSDEASRVTRDIGSLLDHCGEFPADGYYIVVEHPGGSYLVDDPIWLSNIIDLCAGLRIQGSRVVIGYCNHQMLLAALAKPDAIASGTWMNVRSFPPDKFRAPGEEEVRQRAAWYYCPQAFSEYKVPYLDIAQLQGVLGDMYPYTRPVLPDIDNLFNVPQPSTIKLNEQHAFRHYLHSLLQQAEESSLDTFQATVDSYRMVLDRAENLLQRLASVGVRGQLRDFGPVLDANRAAMDVFVAARGAYMSRVWPDL